VNDVKTGLIKSRRIVFTPDTDLKEELQATAIQITCYDRDGNIVKRVTSADGGVVEDPDEDNSLTPDPSPNGEGNENQSGNTGGEDED
jgi:Tol biopolymer transport system component